ncbi:MAG TPA: hypothetical protein O0X39_02635 [Methanocorpusculum sp.]|nr:hypothetical protein [Methanocorpusculum sp.]
MKPEEEVDWKIFHLVPESKPALISELIEKTGYERSVVEASLMRLEKSCLLTVAGEEVHAMSIQDFFMANEIKQSMADDPFLEIENGVIKVRK